MVFVDQPSMTVIHHQQTSTTRTKPHLVDYESLTHGCESIPRTPAEHPQNEQSTICWMFTYPFTGWLFVTHSHMIVHHQLTPAGVLSSKMIMHRPLTSINLEHC